MSVEKQVSDEGQQQNRWKHFHRAEKYWLWGSRLCRHKGRLWVGATASPALPPHSLWYRDFPLVAIQVHIKCTTKWCGNLIHLISLGGGLMTDSCTLLITGWEGEWAGPRHRTSDTTVHGDGSRFRDILASFCEEKLPFSRRSRYSPLKCINSKRVGVIFISCVSEHTARSWKYSSSLNMKQYITFTGRKSWLDFFCFLFIN